MEKWLNLNSRRLFSNPWGDPSIFFFTFQQKQRQGVCSKQTNKFLPNNKTTQQNQKKTSTPLSPYISLACFAMLFIIYIYYIYILHHQVQPPLPLESSGGSLRLQCTVASGECLRGGVRCETLMSIPCEEKKHVHKNQQPRGKMVEVRKSFFGGLKKDRQSWRLKLGSLGKQVGIALGSSVI